MIKNNNNLRKEIVQTVINAGEGHIPSSLSILDIIDYLYSKKLKFKKNFHNWDKRDYFILSKGHGCVALYVVLKKFGFIKKKDLDNYGEFKSILGGHPDSTKIPGIEACTGSLGHGFPTAVGTALGLKIQNKKNRIFVLIGDGECHEGSIWETANIANNQNLGNLCAILDWNGSAEQLMPKDKLLNKWKSFGWQTYLADGHSYKSLNKVFKKINFNLNGKPKIILAKTTKGKGISFMEGHGKWHHKIPNLIEKKKIFKELSSE